MPYEVLCEVLYKVLYEVLCKGLSVFRCLWQAADALWDQTRPGEYTINCEPAHPPMRPSCSVRPPLGDSQPNRDSFCLFLLLQG